MAGSPLSFAQSLRVIGQDLEGLGVKALELARRPDEYVVRVDCNRPGKTFLQRIAEKINRANKSDASPLRFTAEQIIWSDIERAAHRGDTSVVPDSGKLSLILRVLGNFLDEKEAADFAVSWSSEGARVSYDGKFETFTTDNLYDLGVRMYLKRSTRLPG